MEQQDVYRFTRMRILYELQKWKDRGHSIKAAKAAAAFVLRQDAKGVEGIKEALPHLKRTGSVAYGIALRVLRGLKRVEVPQHG